MKPLVGCAPGVYREPFTLIDDGIHISHQKTPYVFIIGHLKAPAQLLPQGLIR